MVTNRSNQTEQLKSKIKVNNWLVTPEPEIPNQSDNYLLHDQQKRKTKNKLLPEIKKNVAETPTGTQETNTQPTEGSNNKTYFKKDPWLTEADQQTNKRYDTNLPQVNQKQIYELLNKLTNRKPVKINEDLDLFADIQENNHIFTNKNPNRPKVIPLKSSSVNTSDLTNQKKILKPIENQNESNFNSKKQFVIYNQVSVFVNH